MQLQKCRNAAAPKENQEDTSTAPLLVLSLTDGLSTYSALYDPEDQLNSSDIIRFYSLLGIDFRFNILHKMFACMIFNFLIIFIIKPIINLF